MRAVAEVNKYVSDSEPWKIKDDPARLGTILHVTAQCVADLNLVLSPFLPFSANEVDRALGGKGEIAPMPRIDEVEDLDGRPYPIITGDYSATPAVGAAADHGRRAGGQADADLHQARPGDRGRGAGEARCREGEPSRTAFGAAVHRAAHAELDRPVVFEDPLARRILGVDREAVLADVPALRGFGSSSRSGTGSPRTSWPRRVARGVRQVVVLGAGLDTFAYRQPMTRPTRGCASTRSTIPATGAWKRERLAEAGSTSRAR